MTSSVHRKLILEQRMKLELLAIRCNISITSSHLIGDIGGSNSCPSSGRVIMGHVPTGRINEGTYNTSNIHKGRG